MASGLDHTFNNSNTTLNSSTIGLHVRGIYAPDGCADMAGAGSVDMEPNQSLPTPQSPPRPNYPAPHRTPAAALLEDMGADIDSVSASVSNMGGY